MYGFSYTFNLLVNNNQKYYISSLDIYRSDIVTDSDASTVNSYTFTN